MTTLEIEQLESNKIRTISCRVGISNSMLLKVMKENDKIVVVTREGLLKYQGNAQYAYYSGKINKDYKIFSTSKKASEYIQKIIK